MKRQGNFESERDKRLKLDDLWGADLDQDDIENCFIQATQELERQHANQNESILPSYTNIVRTMRDVPSSTQGICNKTVEQTIQRFRIQCEEKDGEISILRSRIKEERQSILLEQKKKQEEMMLKINIQEKEMQTIKSQLAFKDLEIANLKQMQKTISESVSCLSQRQSVSGTTTKCRTGANEWEYRVNVNPREVYPIRNLFKNLTVICCSDDCTCYKDKKVDACVTSLLTDIRTAINMIHCIIQLPLDELNSQNLNQTIEKIVSTCLKCLHQMCLQLESEHPLNHCLSHSDKLSAAQRTERTPTALEIMIRATGEICKYNNYLYDLICKECSFLKQILTLVQTIGKSKRPNGSICTELLSSVILFLSSFLSHQKISTAILSLCATILREVLLCRPSVSVLECILQLLANTSINENFTQWFCEGKTKHQSDHRTMRLLKDNVKLNPDNCIFYMFAVLSQNIISYNNTDSQKMRSLVDVVYLMVNKYSDILRLTLKDDMVYCDCLTQLYKITIDIVAKIAESNLASQDNNSFELKNQFIGFVKFLSLLTFNSYDLMERHIDTFPKYKSIVFTLMKHPLLRSAAEQTELTQMYFCEDLLNMKSMTLHDPNDY